MKTTQLLITNEQLQSKVISFLRFPLIVAVVFIHTQIDTINGVKGEYVVAYPFGGQYPLYESTLYICAQIIARVAVPLFFIFSGFLFFYKSEEFTARIYAKKLKKRVHTLLIPYLFWNILVIVMYAVVGMLLPGTTEISIAKGYNVSDWLMTLWNHNGSGYPISAPFWFIRDLMVVSLFTPIIYWLTKTFNYYFPILLCLLWFMGWWFNITFNIDALFFFTVGAYFSITKKSFVEFVKYRTLLLGILYLVCAVFTFYAKSFDWYIYISRMGILLGVAFAISLTAKFIEKDKWKEQRFLTESSFFIFAYHVIALPIILRLLLFVVPCTTDVRATILYFTWAILVIVLGLILYYFLKKWLPRTTAFITGGR